MWAGNQANAVIDGKRHKLWGRKGEVVPCMIICSFISALHVHSVLYVLHSCQSAPPQPFHSPLPRPQLPFSYSRFVCVKATLLFWTCEGFDLTLTRLCGGWLLQGLRVWACVFKCLVCVCLRPGINRSLFWVVDVDWAVLQLHTESLRLLIYPPSLC